MDEQEQAQQALFKQFRRDKVEAAAHPARKRGGRLGPLAPWLIATAAVVFVLFPVAFVVLYPRFGPVDTMTSFCSAEGAGKYDAAYAMLSQRAQQQESLDAFTKASRNANLISCSANQGLPIILGGERANLNATFLVGETSSNFTGVDGSMSFVSEHGAWRVDSMDPDLLDLPS
jgi:hypothetical protein